MTVNDRPLSTRLLVGRAVPAGNRHRRIDHAAVAARGARPARALGADLDAEALEDTPRRVADAYAELLTPQPFRADHVPQRRRLRRADRRAGDPVPLAVHAPPAPVPRRGARRLPPRRADHRPEQARPRRRAVRPRPADPGTPDDADRRLARSASSSPRASGSCWRPSTCACRCAACRSSAPRP